MFEDALVESSGRLQSRSKYWMLATFAFNLAVVAGLVLLPLLNPAALPRTAMTALLVAPPPPPRAAASPAPTQAVRQNRPVAPLNSMVAPARVPHTVDRSSPPLPPADGVLAGQALAENAGAADGVFRALGLADAPPAVTKQPDRPKQAGPVRVSSGVAAGALLTRTAPAYPAIAKAAHVSGAVLLHAVIAKTGSIESLQVVSGPEMLRASALDAVRQWRYRPYLLNGEPTEVETTITVNFTFGG